MPFGAQLREDGGTRFRLWAPGAGRVDLDLTHAGDRLLVPMQALENGWFEASVAGAGAGTRYSYRIDGGLGVPDPASRCNPDDVHAASMVIDPRAWEWTDHDWRGRPWEEAVIYELHIGTFTTAGTYAAVESRLDYLVELGVTALELMPVADFPGKRNWGYDGVLLFAPDTGYGQPEDLKHMIAAAHARGLMVLLDVVYNHFGPEGNYLGTYAPQFFNQDKHTPWGAALNFDGPGSATVRDFFIHNALYWIEEYHLDGLRLDAVHAIADQSRPGFIADLASAVRYGPGSARQVHLVLENDFNQARHLLRDGRRGTARADAQWNDDLHHAFHVLATGERDGYYVDYASQPVWFTGRALAEGFGFQGEPSSTRGGIPRGEPSAHLPATAFVSFLQTHDQVGNRALGERLSMLAGQEPLAAAIACLLLSPHIPLLFMGEEFAATAPFLFFCDFGPELAGAVREGRRAEFGRFEKFRDPRTRETIPDPNAAATFLASKLNWAECGEPGHKEWHDLYRTLLRLRRTHLVPRLSRINPGGRFTVLDGAGLSVGWDFEDGGRLRLLANLSADSLPDVERPPGQVVYASHAEQADGVLPAWSVVWTLEEPERQGG